MRVSQITSVALAAITLSMFELGFIGNVLAVATRTDPGEELASVSRDTEGFPLPDGATGRLGSMRFWQKVPVNFLFFLPPGRQVVSTEEDCIIIWEARTGKRIGTLHGHRGNIDIVVASCDGKLLASSGEDRTVRIWDSLRSVELRQIERPDVVRALCFTGDCRSLAILEWDGTVELWDLATRRIHHSFRTDLGKIVSLASSPDGKLIATGREDCGRAPGVQLWNSENGTPRPRSSGLDAGNHSLAFSPDSTKLVTSGAFALTQLWSMLRVGEKVTVSSLLTKNHLFAAFAPDGRSIATAGGFSDEVQVFDARSGREIHRFNLWTNAHVVAYSPNGRQLAGAGKGHTIRLWDLDTERESVPIPGHRTAVRSIAFSPDGSTLASVDLEGNLIFWNTASHRDMRRVVDPERTTFRSVAFAPDGKSVAAVSIAGPSRVWEVGTGRELLRIKHDDFLGVQAVAFAPDGNSFAAGCKDGSVRVWDAKAGNELRRFERGSEVLSVAFSPDGRFLATGCEDGSAAVGDADSGRELRRFDQKDAKSVRSVAFSPDGHSLAAASDGLVRIWEVKTKRQLRQWDHAGTVYAVAFSWDGRLLASASEDGSVRLWDQSTGLQTARYAHDGEVHAVAFAPDGKTLAAGGSDCKVILWGTPESRLKESDRFGR
jgi:WD40 repeat protein